MLLFTTSVHFLSTERKSFKPVQWKERFIHTVQLEFMSSYFISILSNRKMVIITYGRPSYLEFFIRFRTITAKKT